jgi:exodeoxyribonuclease VII large subunit
MNIQTLTLYELGTLIRRVISLNFQDKVWVKAEISGCKLVRGIAYLDLIQKEEGNSDKIISQQSAVIWQNTMQHLNQKLPEPLAGFLESGREVLLLVQVDFNARYGLKLIIEDIDPAYTLGRMFQQRQELEKLIYSEKLHEQNKKVKLPAVIQSIAILSNDQAAGYQDFIHQLIENSSGYTFRLDLFPISLQGTLVEETALQQLREISRSSQKYDAVLILRGGGSKLDLAGFDSINICRSIASFPIKIITGIGHEIDETLVDLVAGISLKTPTAVAAYILQHNQLFETAVQEMVQTIQKMVKTKIHETGLQLTRFQHELSLRPMRLVERTHVKLEHLQKELPKIVRNRIKKEELRLTYLDRLINLVSIPSTLKRGFTITVLPGNLPIKAGVRKDMQIETIWEKGSFRSIIIDKPT